MEKNSKGDFQMMGFRGNYVVWRKLVFCESSAKLNYYYASV